MPVDSSRGHRDALPQSRNRHSARCGNPTSRPACSPGGRRRHQARPPPRTRTARRRRHRCRSPGPTPWRARDVEGRRIAADDEADEAPCLGLIAGRESRRHGPCVVVQAAVAEREVEHGHADHRAQVRNLGQGRGGRGKWREQQQGGARPPRTASAWSQPRRRTAGARSRERAARTRPGGAGV